MSYTNKRILVTGADGFIGSHLVETLLDEGCIVKAFTYYNSFNSWGWLDTFSKDKLKNIEIYAGDIRDPNGVKTAIRNVERAMGDGIKKPANSEIDTKDIVRKSLVAARDIKAGKTILSDDIIIKRPGNGISPESKELIINKVVKVEIKRMQFLNGIIFKRW